MSLYRVRSYYQRGFWRQSWSWFVWNRDGSLNETLFKDVAQVDKSQVAFNGLQDPVVVPPARFTVSGITIQSDQQTKVEEP